MGPSLGSSTESFLVWDHLLQYTRVRTPGYCGLDALTLLHSLLVLFSLVDWMPHCRSFRARAVRRQRAINRGYLATCQVEMNISSLAGRATVQIVKTQIIKLAKVVPLRLWRVQVS